jgi:hypothetical protein
VFIPDTEEVTGSIPVSPTTELPLSSGNAARDRFLVKEEVVDSIHASSTRTKQPLTCGNVIQAHLHGPQQRRYGATA